MNDDISPRTIANLNKTPDTEAYVRVLIFPAELALVCFKGISDHAANAGTITYSERREWCSEIETLAKRKPMFGPGGYFLFRGTVA